MSIALSGALPHGDYNGLGPLGRHLVNDPPGTMHLVVALVDCSKIVTSMETGAIVPTARIRAIEGFAGSTAAAQELRRMWRRAYELRTGQAELPLDLDTTQLRDRGLRLVDPDGGTQ